MTATQISTDVARGIIIRQQIKDLQAELKTIEKRLESAGLEGSQIPLQEEDREGRQFLARSPQAGVVVPVVFESDQIVASCRVGDQLHTGLMAFAETYPGTNVSQFYQTVTTLQRVPKDGQAFRKLAREQLGPNAATFVSLCLQRDKEGIPRSRTIIAWDNAKPLSQIPA